MGALATFALAAACATVQQGAESPDAGAVIVELRLEGPLQAVELHEGGRTTRVDLPLAAGERRTLPAPLSLWSPVREASEVAARLALRVEPEDAAGQAAVVAVSGLRPDLWSSGLAPALTMRSRAPLELSSPRPDAVRLALFAAAWLAILASRRRVAWALLAGALAALAMLALPAPRLAQGEVLVLEGDARSGDWVSVRGALGALEVAPGRLPWEDVLGSGDRSRWRVAVGPGAVPRWSLEGPGLQIYMLEELNAPVELTREHNRDLALAEVWVRDPSGGWSAHGRWEAGQPLPPKIPAGPPPGWLATGLPQGIGILLARLDAGAMSEHAPRARAGWLRLVGF